MKKRAVNLPYPGADGTLPKQAWGARAEGSIELTTDAGEHQAFALVLQLVDGRRVALWWNRYVQPSRFELTPLGDLDGC